MGYAEQMHLRHAFAQRRHQERQGHVMGGDDELLDYRAVIDEPDFARRKLHLRRVDDEDALRLDGAHVVQNVFRRGAAVHHLPARSR
jgi:hypothetical protein